MPRFAQRVAEQRLVGPRRAGRDHHAVEPFVADRVRDLLGGIGGAGEQAFLGVNDIGKRRGVFDDGGNVDHSADVGAAVADEDADLGLLFRDVPFRRIHPLSGSACRAGRRAAAPHRAPAPLAVTTDSGISIGPLEGAADEDSRAGGLDRIDRIGLAEAVRIELDAELAGQLLRIRGRIQSDGQAPPGRIPLPSLHRRSVEYRIVTFLLSGISLPIDT